MVLDEEAEPAQTLWLAQSQHHVYGGQVMSFDRIGHERVARGVWGVPVGAVLGGTLRELLVEIDCHQTHLLRPVLQLEHSSLLEIVISRERTRNMLTGGRLDRLGELVHVLFGDLFVEATPVGRYGGLLPKVII
jgi:hypothetical protein